MFNQGGMSSLGLQKDRWSICEVDPDCHYCRDVNIHVRIMYKLTGHLVYIFNESSPSLLRLSLQWRHNEPVCVSNHQPHDCLLNRLFRRRSKETSKRRVTGLCARNSPGTGEFPAQRASNAENVSIWWRHHITNGVGSCFIRHSYIRPGNIRLIDALHIRLMMLCR